jgi:hypothetical protein
VPHTHPLRVTVRLALVALAAATLSAPAQAAAGELNFTPYVWVPGIHGSMGTPGGDSGLGDRVTLEFAPEYRIGGAMLNFSWREARFTAFGDWTYANVRATTPSPYGALYSDVEGQIIGNIGQLFAGYLLLDHAGMKLDGYVGGRVYGITGRLGLGAGLAPEVDLSSTEVWVDAAVGLRFNAVVWRGLVAHVRGDVGSGGSNLTWQAYGAMGWQFGWGALLAGWRHLYIDKGEGDLRMKLALSGPVLGANFTF